MSYGTDAPQGLQPFSYLNGALWNGQQSSYRINPLYNSQIFTGDPVTLNAAGTLVLAVPGTAMIGVFNGCRYQAAAGNQNTPLDYAFWGGATALATGQLYATAYVIDDPNVLFNIQSDNVQPGNVAPNGILYTNIGNNIEYIAGAGNQVTGQSGYVLDTTTIGNGAGLSLKLYDFTPVVGNPIFSAGNPIVGYGQFNNALVLINNHRFKTGVAGV